MSIQTLDDQKQWRGKLEKGKGAIFILGLTDRESNRFQKKSIVENTIIWICNRRQLSIL